MSENLEEQPFGSWLKEQRVSKKISLEEIAAVTKVHIAQLKMIEEDHWKDLPAPAFVRGFLLCYAKYIELEEEEVLRRYKNVMGKNIRTIESALPAGYKSVQGSNRPKVRVASTPNFLKSPGASEINFSRTPFLTPKSIAILGALILGIVLLTFFISLGRKKESLPEKVPERSAPTVESQTQPVTTESEILNETPAIIPVVNIPKHSLELIGVEESWVIIKNADEASEGFSLKAKERRSFEISPKVQLVLSNAGALEIKWDGVHYASPGFRGDVKRLRLPDQIELLNEKKVAKVNPPSTPRIVPTTSLPPLPGQAPAPSQTPVPKPVPSAPTNTSPATLPGLGLPGAPTDN